jgi:hypothetical protein
LNIVPSPSAFQPTIRGTGAHGAWLVRQDDDPATWRLTCEREHHGEVGKAPE